MYMHNKEGGGLVRRNRHHAQQAYIHTAVLHNEYTLRQILWGNYFPHDGKSLPGSLSGGPCRLGVVDHVVTDK